jgi:hypothetical protein
LCPEDLFVTGEGFWIIGREVKSQKLSYHTLTLVPA